MDKEPTQQTLDEQLDLISEQLQTEMKRFSNIEALGTAVYLSEAEKQLKDLQDVRTKFLGKKSEFASLKKSIGRVAAEDRASFGQLVQQTEAIMTASINEAEQSLKNHIETARTERDSLDVTIPGRRPRPAAAWHASTPPPRQGM